ncbi:MAG TPA: response regulator transcription factor [Candidatus Acidoferrales bacterium]|nr:response regulator transcription factor [Candidatus Acidoferrales bacterium]
MKLMIIDDHAGMRSTIRQLIAAPGDNVVECSSGDEALQMLVQFKPDCVTVDVSMPGSCAFKTMRAIREAHPAARVICVTSHDQPDYRRAAYDAGASGFVVKDNLSDLYLLVATKRLLSRLHL